MKSHKNDITFMNSENGNIMAILLGGIAMVGLLGALTYSLLSGPVRGMQYVTLKTTTENQMITLAKIIAMDTVFEENASDCDADNIIEPLAWRSAAGANAPTNGGFLPTSIGTATTDSWGTEYGYCVWDHGTASDDIGCGGPGLNRLDGADDPSAGGDASQQLSIALISAGEDRQFSTTCKNYATAVTDGSGTIVSTGDDLVYSYTYNEASVASASLWALKIGDSTTSTIDKSLEITNPGGGVGDFIAVNTVGRILASGGVDLGDESSVTNCDAMNIGLLRYNTTIQNLQVCFDTGGGVYNWTSIAAGGASSIWTDNTSHISYASAHITDLTETALPAAIVSENHKFYWYSDKGALRSGSFAGATNFESNIGSNSAAFGHNNIADYSGAFASGYLNNAYERAVAIGSRNTAQGNGPLAFGYSNTTTNNNSIAIGTNNESRANRGTVFGENGIVRGDQTMLFSLGNPSGSYELTDTHTYAIMGGRFGIDNVDPQAKVHIDGNLLIKQDGDPCDTTRNGTLQYDVTIEDFTICDGTNDLTIIDVDASTAYFALYPRNVENISISEAGPPASSAAFTLTFRNIGTGDGATITTSLTNHKNFEIITDNCTGNNSTAGSSCTITLRAIASEMGSFEGYAIVSDGTHHGIAYLKGMSGTELCPFGSDYGGGKIAACEDGHYLIATPGGCTDSATPTCNGSDFVTKVFHPFANTVYIGSASLVNGMPNTNSLVQAASQFAAAKYCSDMNFGGYTDWYLPAYEELVKLANQRDLIGGFIGATYQSSTQISTSTFRTYNLASNSDAYPNNYNNLTTRCVRRDTSIPAPSTERAGYFVLSKDKHDGNFGTMQDAHDFCLNQVDTYNWKGKENATDLGLISNGNVRAFLCPSWTASDCGQLLSNARFYFAVADETEIGGASFTTTPAAVPSYGLAPHDTETWAQESHFGYVSTSFWTNRSGSGDEWGDVGFFDQNTNNPSVSACGTWERDTGNHRGHVGFIAPHITNEARWGGAALGTREQMCSIPHRVICVVNP